MFDTTDEFKVGNYLKARKTFIYPIDEKKALIEGESYKITAVTDNGIMVRTAIGSEAIFRFNVVLEYFSHMWVG